MTNVMDDAQVGRALETIDAYRVVKSLSHKPGYTTDLAVRAQTRESNQAFVIKHIAKSLTNREVWERYGVLRCPYLPRLIDMLELPDELVVILEFIPGENLENFVRQHGLLDHSSVRHIMGNLCEAAGCLASVNIVHRDIKPSNIIISLGGAYLIDPGIARISHFHQERDTTLLGTWGYASPEQMGYAQTDARSDVFSLGRVFAFLLTGIEPTDPQRCFQALEFNPRLPRQWCLAIQQACLLEPSLRPANPQALERLIDGVATSYPSSFSTTSGSTPVATSMDLNASPESPRDAPTLGVRPVELGSPRPVMYKVLAGVIAVIALFIGTLACRIGFSIQGVDMPRWIAIIFGFVIGIFWFYGPAITTIQALLHTGAYEKLAHPVKRCLAHLFYWIVVGFFILFVLAILS